MQFALEMESLTPSQWGECLAILIIENYKFWTVSTAYLNNYLNWNIVK